MTVNYHACNCIGPQNGEPLCPCQMRGVTIKDGRYQRVEDLGPVVKHKFNKDSFTIKSRDLEEGEELE
jgi:hypothetical protein